MKFVCQIFSKSTPEQVANSSKLPVRQIMLLVEAKCAILEFILTNRWKINKVSS